MADLLTESQTQQNSENPNTEEHLKMVRTEYSLIQPERENYGKIAATTSVN